MKINSIKAGAEKFIRNIKCRNEDRYLNNYIRIHDNFMNENTAKELMECRKTLANYLSREGVSIDIYEAGHEMGEIVNPTLEKASENKISIHAKDILTGRSETHLMVADTKATYPHIEKDYFQIDNPSEGIEFSRITTHEYEDTFLRALYRNVSDIVNSIRGRKY